MDCEQTERVYISDYPELCAATREDVGFAHWEDPRTDSRLRFMTGHLEVSESVCLPGLMLCGWDLNQHLWSRDA